MVKGFGVCTSISSQELVTATYAIHMDNTVF